MLDQNVGNATGYLFPAGAPTDHSDDERLVTVSDDPALDPGSADLSLTVRLVTRGDGDVNILQKGQAATDGGYYKLEADGGVPDCVFGDGQRNYGVGATARVDDGAPHVVTCSRTTDSDGTVVLRIAVDGDDRVVDTGAAPFSITNDAPVTIGGKSRCSNAPGAPDCDYFEGWLGRAEITVG